MSNKTKIIAALIIFLITISYIILSNNFDNDYDKLVVEPTCIDSGYAIYTYKNGGSETKDEIEALGHDFSGYEIEQNAESVNLGYKTRKCKRCNEIERIPYIDSDFKTIILYGDTENIKKDKEVFLKGYFMDEKVDVSLKYQGHASLKYDKKNYTIKFYEDDLTSKRKLKLEDWNKESKYILKANYKDITVSRNVVCANIWSDIVKSESNIPKELSKTSNYGAIDGFPIALYINDEYVGLYTLNLHKDDDLFKMGDLDTEAIVVINYNDLPESKFKEESKFNSSSDWEVEYCSSEDDAWAKDSINSLINFVINSSDQEFKDNLDDYLSVESAIDYMISSYALGLRHHLTQDAIFYTYDNEKWYMSLYDLDDAFNFDNSEIKYYGYDEKMPEYKDGVWDSTTGSVLFDRVLNLFEDEIRGRYKELRGTIFSENQLIERFEEFRKNIPDIFYEEDLIKYPRDEYKGFEQIYDFINNRFSYLDQLFEYEVEG